MYSAVFANLESKSVHKLNVCGAFVNGAPITNTTYQNTKENQSLGGSILTKRRLIVANGNSISALEFYILYSIALMPYLGSNWISQLIEVQVQGGAWWTLRNPAKAGTLQRSEPYESVNLSGIALNLWRSVINNYVFHILMSNL